jgi:uncharacterized peroxidase-related enzyme
MVDALQKDPLTTELRPEDKALVVYAEKLTRRPEDMTSDDVDTLRSAGFDDRAIHDAAQVIALFNYYNRIADGLGVVLDDNGDDSDS